MLDVSEKEEDSMVAKYSERRFKISEWAYITRFRAVAVRELGDDEEDDCLE